MRTILAVVIVAVTLPTFNLAVENNATNLECRNFLGLQSSSRVGDCASEITAWFCSSAYPLCDDSSNQFVNNTVYCSCANSTFQMYLEALDVNGTCSEAKLYKRLLNNCSGVYLDMDDLCTPSDDSPSSKLDQLKECKFLLIYSSVALLMGLIIINVCGCCCFYHCCVPREVPMDDLELVLDSIKDISYKTLMRERMRSRMSSISSKFLQKFRKTRFQGHYVNHSELPEPYKTILQDKKQLVLQHRKITLDEIIAKGTVGELYAGTLLDLTGGNLQLPIKVAVRVIDDVSTECDAAGMVKAIAEVADLNHPHLLLPMGVAIQREMPIYIVYSFMTNGDVKNFLKYNSKGKDLLRTNLIFQASLGMEFLAANGTVHRNLSASHCLLDHSMTLKISGFGAAANPHNASTYALPADQLNEWKWMAFEVLPYIETLQKDYFSEKTDVWSFGITAWEIFTLLEPYRNQFISDVLPLLEDGERLRKPPNCTDEMYQLWRECWHPDRENRPTFTEISRSIHSLLMQSVKWELKLRETQKKQETKNTQEAFKETVRVSPDKLKPNSSNNSSDSYPLYVNTARYTPPSQSSQPHTLSIGPQVASGFQPSSASSVFTDPPVATIEPATPLRPLLSAAVLYSDDNQESDYTAASAWSLPYDEYIITIEGQSEQGGSGSQLGTGVLQKHPLTTVKFTKPPSTTSQANVAASNSTFQREKLNDPWGETTDLKSSLSYSNLLSNAPKDLRKISKSISFDNISAPPI